MDLQRMLEKCQRGQWSIDDLDWSGAPRPMARQQEMAIVQHFVDMAGIERLARALFVEQQRRTDDPLLRAIFATFIADEERHARVAEKLARFYDVHHYRDYRMNPALVDFCPAFVDAIRYVSAEFANVYITTGELLLDVALLRSLGDFVADPMCSRALHLINRDEARHIAVDYYMFDHYARTHERHARTRSAGEWLQAGWSFARVLRRGGPFIQQIFMQPMQRLDPSRVRIRQAFKSMQLLGRKPEWAERPFPRFLLALHRLHNTPILGALLGRALAALVGIPDDALTAHYTASEARRVRHMSFAELAREARRRPD